MGDLNAKNVEWGCHSTNLPGRTLSHFLDRHDYTLHSPAGPTHFGPVGRPDILDIAVTKGIRHYSYLKNIPDSSSDHNPIIIDIHIPIFRTINIVNWKNFNNYLQQTTTPIKTLSTEEDIDQETETFTNEIQSALMNNTTTTTVQSTFPFTTPRNIKNLISLKRRACKKAQRTLAPEDKRQANQLTNRLRSTLKEHNNNRWENRLSDIQQDHTAVWKIIRGLKGQETPIPPYAQTPA